MDIECRISRKNGYNISASAKSLEEAKKKFLDKLADPRAKVAPTRKSRRLVANIADEWLSCKTNVSPSTIKCYRSHLDQKTQDIVVLSKFSTQYLVFFISLVFRSPTFPQLFTNKNPEEKAPFIRGFYTLAGVP